MAYQLFWYIPSTDDRMTMAQLYLDIPSRIVMLLWLTPRAYDAEVLWQLATEELALQLAAIVLLQNIPARVD